MVVTLLEAATMPEGVPQNELQKKLQSRRNEIDKAKGANFHSEIGASLADAASHKHQPGQFTPRSRHCEESQGGSAEKSGTSAAASPPKAEEARDGTVLIAASNLEDSVEVDAQSNASTVTAEPQGEASAASVEAVEQLPTASVSGVRPLPSAATSAVAVNARSGLLIKDVNLSNLPAFAPAPSRSNEDKPESQSGAPGSFAPAPKQGAYPRSAASLLVPDEAVKALPPTSAIAGRQTTASSLQPTNGTANPFAMPPLPGAASGPVPSDLGESSRGAPVARPRAPQPSAPRAPPPSAPREFMAAPTPAVPPPASVAFRPASAIPMEPLAGVQRLASSPSHVQRMASAPSQPVMQRAAPATSPQIWHAIVDGDLRTLEGLVAGGQLSSGRLLDHNGHSVFWDAIAFQQPDIALWLLRQFPPGEPLGQGVHLGEIHARRNDSLLHLCLYLNQFTAGAADVFKAIFTGTAASSPPRELANHSGLTFVHIAAARLNFWALRTALSLDSGTAALFHKPDLQGQTPLATMLRCAEEAAGPMTRLPPARPPVQPVPWSPLARHMPKGPSTEAPPFADLIVEVEDPHAEGGVARVHVHRIVLSANSKAFDMVLRQMPRGETLRVDSQCCRSVEVLLAMLKFLYVGEVSCQHFAGDAIMLWQLLCLCAQYNLPAPLTAYARTALLASLSSGDRQDQLLPALLLMADQVELTPLERAFAALALLAAPATLAAVRGGHEAQARVLLAALTEVERHVLAAQQGVPPTFL